MAFEISRVRLPIMTLEQISLTENQLNMLKTNKKIIFQYSYGHAIRVLPRYVFFLVYILFIKYLLNYFIV